MRGGKRVLSPAVSSFFGVTTESCTPLSHPPPPPPLPLFPRVSSSAAELVPLGARSLFGAEVGLTNCCRARREKPWVRGTLFWSQNRPWVQLLFVSEAFEMQWRQM